MKHTKSIPPIMVAHASADTGVLFPQTILVSNRSTTKMTEFDKMSSEDRLSLFRKLTDHLRAQGIMYQAIFDAIHEKVPQMTRSRGRNIRGKGVPTYPTAHEIRALFEIYPDKLKEFTEEQEEKPGLEELADEVDMLKAIILREAQKDQLIQELRAEIKRLKSEIKNKE